MKSTIRLEVLGMVFIIVILAIFAMYHRDSVERYHNEYNLMYGQIDSNESNQIIEKKQKQENLASLVSSLKQQYLDRSGVKKLSKICWEQAFLFSMSPAHFMYNHKNIAVLLDNSEQNKNTGDREENK